MADLVVIVGVLAFFGLAALFIAVCDRIIGPDEVQNGASSEAGEAR
jgi:hypothetical protein